MKLPKLSDEQLAQIFEDFALPLAAASETGQHPSNVKQWIKTGQLKSFHLADGRQIVRVSDLIGMQPATPGRKAQ